MAYYHALLESLICFIKEDVPKKIEDFVTRNNLFLGEGEENYEQFMQSTRRIYSYFDSVRISSIYIRFHSNINNGRDQAFGRAIVEEVENDMLNEVIITNNNLSM